MKIDFIIEEEIGYTLVTCSESKNSFVHVEEIPRHLELEDVQIVTRDAFESYNNSGLKLKLLANIVGPVRLVNPGGLPFIDNDNKPEAITRSLLYWNEDACEYQVVEMEKLPKGVQLQDYPEISLEEFHKLDKELLRTNWDNFTKNNRRTKIRRFNFEKKTRKKGGDPNFRIKKPAHSFASKAEHRRIYNE